MSCTRLLMSLGSLCASRFLLAAKILRVQPKTTKGDDLDGPSTAMLLSAVVQ